VVLDLELDVVHSRLQRVDRDETAVWGVLQDVHGAELRGGLFQSCGQRWAVHNVSWEGNRGDPRLGELPHERIEFGRVA